MRLATLLALHELSVRRSGKVSSLPIPISFVHPKLGRGTVTGGCAVSHKNRARLEKRRERLRAAREVVGLDARIDSSTQAPTAAVAPATPTPPAPVDPHLLAADV
jgi:hypothetical protein